MNPAIAAALLSSSRQSGTLVNSFESFEDIRQVSVSNANVGTTPEGVTDGNQALRVTFLPAEWPHVMVTPPSPWNWSNAGGISIDITNPGDAPVDFGVRLDDDPKGDGWLHSRTARGIVQAKQSVRAQISFGSDPESLGMRGLPPLPGGSLATTGGGKFDAGHVVNFQVFLHSPATPTALIIDNVRLLAPVSMKGIVDAFGQFTGADWPGKVNDAGAFALRAKAEAEELTRHPSLADLDRFGGWTAGPSLKATGFFRTERRSGKWWFVDPEGRLFFSTGIDSIDPSAATFVTGREAMFTSLPARGSALGAHWRHVALVHSGPTKQGDAYDFYAANLNRKYGTDYYGKWQDVTLRRMRAWGFNTIGNWAAPTFVPNGRTPYVATAGVYGDFARIRRPTDYWSAMPDPYDPKFAEAAVHGLASIADRIRTDPWCLGYFVDNELSWAGPGPDGPYSIALGTLAAPPGTPAKRPLVDLLKAKYVSVEKFNSAWGLAIHGWNELEASIEISKPLTEAARADAGKFVHDFARQYFTVVRDSLRKLDPNHLYLGCRFAWHSSEEEAAAAEVCDVVSYNIYAPKLDKSWDHVATLGKPCIVGEFHFGALDRGMFHPGLVSTPDQDARAAMYEDYVRSALLNPAFVGCHWFQYVDEPLTGRTYDGENYNIGLVSVTDTPYPEMIRAARDIHGKMYRIRDAGR